MKGPPYGGRLSNSVVESDNDADSDLYAEQEAAYASGTTRISKAKKSISVATISKSIGYDYDDGEYNFEDVEDEYEEEEQESETRVLFPRYITPSSRAVFCCCIPVRAIKGCFFSARVAYHLIRVSAALAFVTVLLTLTLAVLASPDCDCSIRHGFSRYRHPTLSHCIQFRPQSTVFCIGIMLSGFLALIGHIRLIMHFNRKKLSWMELQLWIWSSNTEEDDPLDSWANVRGAANAQVANGIAAGTESSERLRFLMYQYQKTRTESTVRKNARNGSSASAFKQNELGSLHSEPTQCPPVQKQAVLTAWLIAAVSNFASLVTLTQIVVAHAYHSFCVHSFVFSCILVNAIALLVAASDTSPRRSYLATDKSSVLVTTPMLSRTPLASLAAAAKRRAASGGSIPITPLYLCAAVALLGSLFGMIYHGKDRLSQMAGALPYIEQSFVMCHVFFTFTLSFVFASPDADASSDANDARSATILPGSEALHTATDVELGESAAMADSSDAGDRNRDGSFEGPRDAASIRQSSSSGGVGGERLSESSTNDRVPSKQITEGRARTIIPGRLDEQAKPESSKAQSESAVGAQHSYSYYKTTHAFTNGPREPMVLASQAGVLSQGASGSIASVRAQSVRNDSADRIGEGYVDGETDPGDPDYGIHSDEEEADDTTLLAERHARAQLSATAAKLLLSPSLSDTHGVPMAPVHVENRNNFFR